MTPARARVIVACQVAVRERDICAGGNVVDNRRRNIAGRHSVAQALEDLEMDEKAQRGHRTFRGAMGQEELSGGGRVNLVEFLGCQRPFQPGIGGMFNQCHENDVLPTSSLYFHLWMCYTAAKIP